MEIAGKKLTIKHIDGPLGVRGRNPACPALTWPDPFCGGPEP